MAAPATRRASASSARTECAERLGRRTVRLHRLSGVRPARLAANGGLYSAEPGRWRRVHRLRSALGEPQLLPGKCWSSRRSVAQYAYFVFNLSADVVSGRREDTVVHSHTSWVCQLSARRNAAKHVADLRPAQHWWSSVSSWSG